MGEFAESQHSIERKDGYESLRFLRFMNSFSRLSFEECVANSLGERR